MNSLETIKENKLRDSLAVYIYGDLPYFSKRKIKDILKKTHSSDQNRHVIIKRNIIT